MTNGSIDDTVLEEEEESKEDEEYRNDANGKTVKTMHLRTHTIHQNGDNSSDSEEGFDDNGMNGNGK